MSLGKSAANPWLRRGMIGVPAIAVVVGGYAIVSLATGRPAAVNGSHDGGSVARSDQTSPSPLPTLPAAGAGPESLVGRIVDGGGAGVGGLSVTAGIDEAAADGPGVDLTPAVVAVTGSTGEFRLAGVFPGRYRIRLEGPGIVTSEVRFVNVPGAALNVVVARTVNLRGVVLGADGRPALAARVRGLSGSGLSLDTVTDGDGRFAFDHIAEDIYHVWAEHDALAAPAARVDRFGAGPFEPIELALGPAATVRGRVVDVDTREGIVAEVTLVPEGDGEPPRTTRSGADGWFEARGLPMGPVSAQALAPGFRASESVRFDTESGYQPDLRMSRGGVIEGMVVDDRGAPMVGVAVGARGKDLSGRARVVPDAFGAPIALSFGPDDSGGGSRFVPRGELGVMVGPIPFPPARPGTVPRVAIPTVAPPAAGLGDTAPPPLVQLTTGSNGRFRITGIEPGRYRVVATRPGYAESASELVAVGVGGSPRKLRLVLVRGVFVIGGVRGDAGPVAGAQIVVTTAAASSLTTITSGDGQFRIGPVIGEVTLSARAAGYGDREIVVTLPGGTDAEHRVDVILASARLSLAGRVRDSAGFPVRGATVSVPSLSRRGTTDDSGRFDIAGVAAGRYSAQVSQERYPSKQVEVSTARPAELTLDLGGGIAVNVRDAHSRMPIAGARVVGAAGAARAAAVSDGRGVATLRALVAGVWRLEVGGPGYVTSTATVTVPVGRRPGDITVRDRVIDIQRGATVSGTVRDENGDRVRGAVVSVGPRSGTSDQAGRFRLEAVRTGDVTIAARRGKRRGQLTVGLAPGDELVTLQVTVAPVSEPTAATDAGGPDAPPDDDLEEDE